MPTKDKSIGLSDEDEDDQDISDDEVESDAEEKFLEERFSIQATGEDEDMLIQDIEQHLDSIPGIRQPEDGQAFFIPDDPDDPVYTASRDEISVESMETLFLKEIPDSTLIPYHATYANADRG